MKSVADRCEFDSEVLALLDDAHHRFNTFNLVRRELISRGRRVTDRDLDKSLQRLRRCGVIEFARDACMWNLTPAEDLKRSGTKMQAFIAWATPQVKGQAILDAYVKKFNHRMPSNVCEAISARPECTCPDDHPRRDPDASCPVPEHNR